MEKISEAVVGKVKLDAQKIIREAEEKAREEIEKAKRKKDRAFGRFIKAAKKRTNR